MLKKGFISNYLFIFVFDLDFINLVDSWADDYSNHNKILVKFLLGGPLCLSLFVLL